MGAVWYRFRAELSTRWHAWLGLALLVGFAAGVVIGAAAGAQRTDTAYDRFLRSQRAYDVAVFTDNPLSGSPFAYIAPDVIAQIPQVAESAHGVLIPIAFDDGIAGLAATDGRIGRTINRFKFVEGRAPDPERADEVAVGFDFADSQGLHVGSTLVLAYPAESSAADECDNPVCTAYGEVSKRILEAVPGGRATVVGIEASPGEFPPQAGGDGTPPVYLTPALEHAVRGRPGTEGLDRDVVMVRLERGEADRAAFVRGLEKRSDGRPVRLVAQHDQAANVQRSMHLQAVALWLLAGLVAVVAVLVLGQVLGRNAFLESTDYSTLGSLGMSRRQRFALGLVRAVVIGAVGGTLAIGVAVLASAFTPTGLARIAEPNLGVRVDTAGVVVGVLATIGLVTLLAAVPAWRASLGPEASQRTPRRRSRLAAAVAAFGCAPTVVTGVGLAVEPGRGRTAVPVRTSIAGVTLGIAALTGALTFGASLTNLLDTPRLYGVTWDLQVASFNEGTDLARDGIPVLRRDPDVRAIGFGGLGLGLEIGGRQVGMVAIDAVEGDVRPPLIEGRHPSAPDEILLGTRTFRRLGVEIGDTIDVRFPGAAPRRLRIVGRGVLPPAADRSLGDGALVTFDGGSRLVPGLADADQGSAFLRLSPGADGRRVVQALEKRLGPDVDASAAPPKPTDVVNFGRVENLPLVVSGVIAVLAAATLAHVLVSATRRRRRDLAILKTLGFVRHQVRAAIAWQASTVALLALGLGIPLGLVAGRAVWTALAHDLGVVAQPVVPMVVVLAIVPAAILLANLIAALPARAAARTRPAVVLRSE
ncbi:MAG: FtsX-like permease family protein [Acidimicrobiia bacterium]